MSNGTIAKQPAILGMIGGEQFKKQLALALPKHMTPDRFARVALTAMRKTPKLMDCTPESVLNCMMSLSQYGLEPDGRRAHLIPYGRECTLILDYKGLAELALRSGIVSTLHADVVREGDIFRYSLGKIVKHVPHYLRRDKDKPAEEGDVYAVYALCENKDGTQKCEVMSIAAVEKIRRRSRSGSNGPWVTDFEEMAKKTVFRRLSKWLVLSPEFRDAISDDEDRETIETTASAVETTKLADLMGRGGEEESKSEEHAAPVSHFDECFQWVEAQPGIEKAFQDGVNLVHWNLPNGRLLIIGQTEHLPRIEDGEPTDLVDCTDADCLTQVKNLIERASKTRR